MPRFAVKTAPQMTTWPRLLEVWQAADGLEAFESAWNFDHFEPILGRPRSGPCLEGWTMLAALAQATNRIRIGCMVTGMPYRHPAVLANMAATVDHISGGRLELGLGAGWNQDESDAYGIDMPPLRERFDRFDEGCEVVIGLLTEDQFSFDGAHYRLRNAFCEPKPVQRPHPPITIGGDGPRRTLRAVARYAQRWNTPFTSPEVLRAKLEVLAAHCADVGRDVGEIDVTAQVLHDPSAGAAATVEAAAALGDAGCDLVVVTLPETCHDAATVEQLAAAIG
ncbi:MAG: LLM class F420-dependent oxidoreductase [Actinomycetes bacterium]